MSYKKGKTTVNTKLFEKIINEVPLWKRLRIRKPSKAAIIYSMDRLANGVSEWIDENPEKEDAINEYWEFAEKMFEQLQDTLVPCTICQLEGSCDASSCDTEVYTSQGHNKIHVCHSHAVDIAELSRP